MSSEDSSQKQADDRQRYPDFSPSTPKSQGYLAQYSPYPTFNGASPSTPARAMDPRDITPRRSSLPSYEPPQSPTPLARKLLPRDAAANGYQSSQTSKPPPIPFDQREFKLRRKDNHPDSPTVNYSLPFTGIRSRSSSTKLAQAPTASTTPPAPTRNPPAPPNNHLSPPARPRNPSPTAASNGGVEYDRSPTGGEVWSSPREDGKEDTGKTPTNRNVSRYTPKYEKVLGMNPR